MSTAISLVNVGKRFGTVQALCDVTLDIQKGELVSLIGPSGCGKTTLLQIVAGLYQPTEGGVYLDNASPKLASSLRQIGIAFQIPALLPSLTALQNVDLTLQIAGRKNSLDPKDLLTKFGLGEFFNHYPHQLSGGMEQRVNIAAAIVHNPKFLLLDEPFGKLDELTRETMCVWLSGVLKEQDTTVIFVTHSVDEAVMLSDRIVVLSPRPGRIHQTFCVPFPKPRGKTLRTDPEFLNLSSHVRTSLFQIMNGGH